MAPFSLGLPLCLSFLLVFSTTFSGSPSIAQATATSPQTSSPPSTPRSCKPDRSCCEPNTAADLCPGCATQSIQQCVCAKHSYCCDTNWDLLCVQAIKHEKCSTDGDGQCNRNPQSCGSVGSMAGCSIESVETCVCKMDDYCCSFEWDASCVDTALNRCNATGDPISPSDGSTYIPAKMTPGIYVLIVVVVLAVVVVIGCAAAAVVGIVVIRRRRNKSDIYTGRELVLHDEIFGLESEDEIFDELAEGDDTFALEDSEEGL